jgi:rhodanese-related sulfurtransferase
MQPELLEIALPPALEHAHAEAIAHGLPYAGSISPPEAWDLALNGQAVLVDVRSNEERVFVGYIPGSVHIPWASGTALNRNPRFARELDAKLGGKDKIVLLLCRSGKRSALAAEAATKAGAPLVFNILEGFEGDLDDHQQRGHVNGWRLRGLPWVQD